MNTRLYVVTDGTMLDSHPPRLIEAANSAAAIRHVAAKYKARVPDSKEVARLVASGIKVEVVE